MANDPAPKARLRQASSPRGNRGYSRTEADLVERELHCFSLMLPKFRSRPAASARLERNYVETAVVAGASLIDSGRR
ncbi:MAG: hypothetical protein HXX15_20900 [Rhodopseudomonas sp.]|uniref:hypothetical protein n=1 Tax=Rhodopseudomonas sp. TaxID=1078 RepID=UPI00180163AF|nr:hypothetical protein [Rhodopseudomonas sp.]NVN88546.1 hypothetical protein [Rhodopseudomonas sp.]